MLLNLLLIAIVNSCCLAAPLSYPLETSGRVFAFDGSLKKAALFAKEHNTTDAQSRHVYKWASTLAISVMNNATAALSLSERHSLDKVSLCGNERPALFAQLIVLLAFYLMIHRLLLLGFLPTSLRLRFGSPPFRP